MNMKVSEQKINGDYIPLPINIRSRKLMKYVNLLCDEDSVVSVESEMVGWVEKLFIENVLKMSVDNNLSIGGEINESDLGKSFEEMKDKSCGYGNDEEVEGYMKEWYMKEWEDNYKKFMSEVKKLGEGGKWYLWGVEYDSNITYVIEC